MSKDKVKRLKTYLERCIRDAATPGLDKPRVDFFKREIVRTEATIQKISQ